MSSIENPWVATTPTGFVARCATREESVRAIEQKSRFGTAWVKNEITGETWQRSFVGGAWEWSQRRRPVVGSLPLGEAKPPGDSSVNPKDAA